MAGVIEPARLLGAAVLYLGLLFLVAEMAERRRIPAKLIDHPWVFSLSLGVYATSWTFFGSVGMAADRGYAFLTIYMGVSLACLLIPVLWLPILRIVRQHRLSSVPDLFAFRYRSQGSAVLATVFVIAASIPYLALQIRALSESAAVLSGAKEAEGAAALAFTVLITAFALLFGARHLGGNEQHRGLVVAIALESVVKICALGAVACAAVQHGFGGFTGFAEWTRAHPEALEIVFSPVRQDSFPTLLLLAFGAGFLLPRQFHLAFAERPDDRALLGATWRFPLILLVLCLAVPPILWAGHRIAPGADPDTFALHLALGHPMLAVVTYVGGLAASSGMMIVTSVALASMAVNHLLLPWWRPQGELLRTVAWARRLVVVVVMLLGLLFYFLFAKDARLASLGLIAFVAVIQLLPGTLGVLYYREASRTGLFLGLSAGVVGWTIMLALPRLGFGGPAESLTRVAARVDPSWTDVWTLATVVSLGLNAFFFMAGSILFPPSTDELVAAEQCGLDVAAGARRMRRPTSPGLLKARLGPLLGSQTATRLVDAAVRDAGLEPGGDPGPQALRAVEMQVDASLTALLGPLLGPAVLDGVSAGATSHLAAQVRFLEERLQSNPRAPVGQVELVRRYLRGVLEDLPVGVCALGPDDEIIVWNRALQELTGLYSRDWIGHELLDLPEPFGPTLMDWVQQEGGPGEVTLTLPDSKAPSSGAAGEARILRVRVTPLAGGGQVVTIEDLTSQRLLERQVAHEDRLRSLGQLTAAVGHEIGNPLTGVLMLSRNLASEPDPEDLPERLRMIVSEAEKIESIVKSMSAFARAGSDAALVAAVRKVPVVVLEVVEDALRLVLLARKNREILWSYDCPEELLALGDKQQLTQVLVNLLTNACDASKPGQPVRVEARPASPRWLEVDVVDEGDGIPENVASRIFEPFFTTKGPGAGTGLGLAVSEGIVRAHGGRMSVLSRPGEGTTMRIVLRRAAEGRR